MLTFQRPTPEDLKQAAIIERKRLVEESRKRRIFNPRCRRIGIDVGFLAKQVEEKKREMEEEQLRESQMDDALIKNSKLALLLEKREEEERRKLNKEINNFRQEHQRPEERRDFDLYDPQSLKKSLPARTADDDDDKHLGLASAQKFQGEDTNMMERVKVQKRQMQSWLMQQVAERRAIEREHCNAEKAYQDAVISRDRRAIALGRMEEKCRKRLNEANARFNRALAEEQQCRKRWEAKREEEDEKAEIFNHVTGDFLTEAHEQAQSNRGPDKPLASRYKGMTSEELKAIRDEQERQMAEIEKLKLEEKRRNEDWDRLMTNNARLAENYQRELDRRRVEIRKRMDEENLKLAEEQKNHRRYLDRVLCKSQPSREFYEQFNKTTR